MHQSDLGWMQSILVEITEFHVAHQQIPWRKFLHSAIN